MARKQWSMVQEGNRLFIFKNAETVVDTNDFAEGAVFVKRVGRRTHTRSRKNHFVRSTHQLSEENRSSFHLATSRLQHTSTLRHRSIAVDQSVLFLGSAATSRRSTTVIPRVN